MLNFKGKRYQVKFDFSNRDRGDFEADVTVQVKETAKAPFKPYAKGLITEEFELQIEPVDSASIIPQDVYENLEYYCECEVDDARRAYEEDNFGDGDENEV
jgi:hypothetical protein